MDYMPRPLVLVGNKEYALQCLESLDGQAPTVTRHYSDFSLFMGDYHKRGVTPLTLLIFPRGRKAINEYDFLDLVEIAQAGLPFQVRCVTDGVLNHDLPGGIATIRPSSIGDLLATGKTNPLT